jgi:hypothetical protein
MSVHRAIELKRLYGERSALLQATKHCSPPLTTDFDTLRLNINRVFVNVNMSSDNDQRYITSEELSDLNNPELDISLKFNLEGDEYSTLEWLEIADIDKMWIEERIDQYGNNLLPDQYNKYAMSRFDLYMAENSTIEPHRIDFERDGSVSFANGMNRFSNMRDMGYTRMPFLVDRSNLESSNESSD